MTMKPQTPPLQDLLDAYAVAGPSLDRLKTWTQAYPQHRDALTVVTVDWLLSEWEHHRSPDQAPGAGGGPTDRRYEEVERALRTFGRSLTPQADTPLPPDEASEASPPEVSEGAATLRELVLQGGEDLDSVLARAHLSFDLFAMLNMGLLTFVEEALRERVAAVLAAAAGVALTQVAQQLRTTRPRLGAGASLSRGKPSASTLDFFEAIDEDEELAESDRAFWRALRTEALTP